MSSADRIHSGYTSGWRDRITTIISYTRWRWHTASAIQATLEAPGAGSVKVGAAMV
jgi:hypothetical protein